MTDTIVYPCEQNQNRYENRLAPVNTGKSTFQKSDWFDRVTIRDLCERSYIFVGHHTTPILLSNKNFWSIFKTCPWRIVHEIS